MMPTTTTGSCLCGAVTFSVTGDIPDPIACHCSMCRKASGHYLVATEVPKTAVTVDDPDAVTWYDSSPKVRRGFCGTCGSTLFFEPRFHDWTAVCMGAFDRPTGTRTKLHIFTDDKGDYYDLPDGVPHNPQ